PPAGGRCRPGSTPTRRSATTPSNSACAGGPPAANRTGSSSTRPSSPPANCASTAPALPRKLRRWSGRARPRHTRGSTAVGVRFFQLLALQRLLDVQNELHRVAADAVTTTEELVNVGAANKPDLLQARIEERQANVALANARTHYDSAWRQLAAFVGRPDLCV